MPSKTAKFTDPCPLIERQIHEARENKARRVRRTVTINLGIAFVLAACADI